MNLRRLIYTLLFCIFCSQNAFSVSLVDLLTKCSHNPKNSAGRSDLDAYGFKENDTRGLGDECAFWTNHSFTVKDSNECIMRLEENLRNNDSESSPHKCKIAESCMKLEILRRTSILETPRARLTYRFCFLGAGGNQSAVLDVGGGCAKLHTRRFCLRPGVRGTKLASKTHEVIDEHIKQGKTPPIRICPYEDSKDAADTDGSYQPSHMMEDENDDSNTALGATMGSIIGVVGTGGAVILGAAAAPFAAVGAALGAFIGHMSSHQNHIVIDNFNACTMLPIQPFPPAYYFEITPINPPVIVRRHCSFDEKDSIKQSNPCINKLPYSDYAQTYVQVGYANQIPLCSPSGTDDFMCAKINNWPSGIITLVNKPAPASHYGGVIKNYEIPNCKDVGKIPCFEILSGDQERKTKINFARILFKKIGDKGDDNKIYNDEDRPLIASAIEATKVNDKNLFFEMSYGFTAVNDKPKADFGTFSKTINLSLFTPVADDLSAIGVRKFALKPSNFNDEEIQLFQGEKMITPIKKQPFDERPIVSKCDSSCGGKNTHSEPRLKFRIYDAAREIGIQEGMSEETYAYGRKFSVEPTDLDYIQKKWGHYYRKDGYLMKQVVGNYDVPPDSGDDDDDDVTLNLDSAKDYDYIDGFEANEGRYLRGGDKLCLTNYDSLENLWVRKLNLTSGGPTIPIPSPFREHVNKYTYSQSQMWKYLINQDVSTIIDINDDPTRKEPNKYAIRAKTPAELGLCVDIPQIEGDCEAIDGNLKPSENGYAAWKKTRLNKVVKGECIDGYEEDGRAPERKCIRGYDKPVFGIIKFPCKAIPEE